MKTNNLTLREVLPSDRQDKYSETVLNTTLKDAIDIAKYDMPGNSYISEEDVNSIREIYRDYEKNGGDEAHSDSSYWNKSDAENEAYWSKDK